MKKRVKSALSGTKTEQNLRTAANGEAMAYTKYAIFADIAKKDGFEEIADVFSAFAGNEKEHAEIWLEYLGEIGNTITNLKNASSGENFESGELYPDASKTAYEEGFTEIGDKFR
ncbi:MAG: rubrerythrin family protein, partial [Clostridiales bacterium]|nr:rubrerythrin family protein [Clostridiales bacterium]